VLLSEEGHERRALLARAELLPEGRSLYEPAYVNLMHHLNAALRAQTSFSRPALRRQDDDVVIVDEFTGRLMPGRRWLTGLHQASRPGKRVDPEREPDLASITFQNYFPHVPQARGHDRHGRHEPTNSRRSTAWKWSSSRPICRWCATIATTRSSALRAKVQAIVADIKIATNADSRCS
jgi:preprotein translocase subunit SecA